MTWLVSRPVAAIVNAVSDAVFAAIDNGRQLTTELQEIVEGWADAAPSLRGFTSTRMRELLLQRPVINATRDSSSRSLGA